ncbi:MCE family protein, partial [Mycobacterium sp.]|uniref:MCE family protein n=1 Tax=Mycobacterium sp. TaxID=1785 RepID=UPI003C74159A
MLTRLVRIQLIIFTIASVIGIAVMVFDYMQVPTLLGLGRITVKLELPTSGGLYRFSNVTYRGIQVGKVTDVEIVPGNHVEATLSLDISPKIPANLVAEVRSISAVGEQYVDLKPRTNSPPYLQNGSVIAMGDTSIPQQVGPMLDQVSTLVNSIPKDKLGALLDESFKAFNGAGYDLGSLLDSSATVTGDLAAVAPRVRSLIGDSAPILDSQVQTADAIKVWARSLAGITEQVATDDPPIRTL